MGGTCSKVGKDGKRIKNLNWNLPMDEIVRKVILNFTLKNAMNCVVLD
jgi:hypothetical protein